MSQNVHSISECCHMFSSCQHLYNYPEKGEEAVGIPPSMMDKEIRSIAKQPSVLLDNWSMWQPELP